MSENQSLSIEIWQEFDKNESENIKKNLKNKKFTKNIEKKVKNWVKNDRKLLKIIKN